MRKDKRAGLTRQTIIQTALGLLDQVGLEGLTVRRLAAELGVQSPALYWHDAITMAAGMGPPHHGESWQHWLARRARAYRRSLLAHRDGARIVANARMSPATLGMLDEELTAMVGCGFTPALALRTIMAIAHYVNGFVLQEQTERQEDTQPPADEPAAMTELADGGDWPTLLVAIREGGSPLGEEAFDHGLRALIDGTTTALTP